MLGSLCGRRRIGISIELPTTPRQAAAGAIWSVPGHWLAAQKGIASISDQSDSRLIIRISGPKVREALAKVPVDLHPGTLGPGLFTIMALFF